MGNLGGELCFLQEASLIDLAAGLQEKLHGHDVVQHAVAGFVDHAHSAATQLLQDLVAIRQHLARRRHRQLVFALELLRASLGAGAVCGA